MTEGFDINRLRFGTSKYTKGGVGHWWRSDMGYGMTPIWRAICGQTVDRDGDVFWEAPDSEVRVCKRCLIRHTAGAAGGLVK